MSMSNHQFYARQNERSRVKAFIVSEYFSAWAKIMLGTQRSGHPSRTNRNIQYIEAFCGPGSYDDGTLSTPLMVLRAAVADPHISVRLVTHFIDHNRAYCERLEREIAQLVGASDLAHKPRVTCHEVGEELARALAETSLVPTLLFADPWGYKGLSRELFEAVLKDFGSECVFFLNYRRINAALTNPKFPMHTDALFGKERAQRLRHSVTSMSPSEREEAFMRALSEAFQESSGKLVLTFCFRRDESPVTSHYLVFVTKHFRGYETMKETMARHSSSEIEGVPTYTYDPRDKRLRRLFEVGQPLTDLKKELLVTFAGRKLTMREIFEKHSVGRPYIARNYKLALNELYVERAVSVGRPPRGRTFADDIVVSFPD